MEFPKIGPYWSKTSHAAKWRERPDFPDGGKRSNDLIDRVDSSPKKAPLLISQGKTYDCSAAAAMMILKFLNVPVPETAENVPDSYSPTPEERGSHAGLLLSFRRVMESAYRGHSFAAVTPKWRENPVASRRTEAPAIKAGLKALGLYVSHVYDLRVQAAAPVTSDALFEEFKSRLAASKGQGAWLVQGGYSMRDFRLSAAEEHALNMTDYESFHYISVVGFDESSNEFIVLDPLKSEPARYTERMMKSFVLHEGAPKSTRAIVNEACMWITAAEAHAFQPEQPDYRVREVVSLPIDKSLKGAEYNHAWLLSFFGKAALPDHRATVLGLKESLKRSYNKEWRTQKQWHDFNIHENIALLRSVGLTVETPFDLYSVTGNNEGDAAVDTALLSAQLKERLLDVDAPTAYVCRDRNDDTMIVYGFDPKSECFLIEATGHSTSLSSKQLEEVLCPNPKLFLKVYDTGIGIRGLNVHPSKHYYLDVPERDWHSDQNKFDIRDHFISDPYLKMRLGWQDEG